jgi:hypothetical protein
MFLDRAKPNVPVNIALSHVNKIDDDRNVFLSEYPPVSKIDFNASS